MKTDFEKQIVFRAKRLIGIRSVRSADEEAKPSE
jgi:hypothetical protein